MELFHMRIELLVQMKISKGDFRISSKQNTRNGEKKNEAFF